MKKNLFILLAVLIIILLVILISIQLFKRYRGEPAPFTPGQDDKVVFPVSGPRPGGADTVTLESEEGRSLPVRNFLNDKTTAKDPQNPGYFYLGNNSFSGASDHSYEIAYIATTQYFNISLFKEPLATARTQAEQYLMNALSLPKEDLCRLKYSVAVPNYISETYSGKDLRFSFCSGSVALPN